MSKRHDQYTSAEYESMREQYLAKSSERSGSWEETAADKRTRTVSAAESRHPALMAEKRIIPKTLEYGYSEPKRNDDVAAEAILNMRKMLGMRRDNPPE